MNKKYQVFVSSTYTDLREERLAVISCLLDNNCIPVGMEQFPASPLSQWDYIKMMIDDSDYYVLIVAGRYGSIDSDTGISYTEKEFNYAKEKNIPIIAFLHENIGNIIGDKLEQENDKRDMLLKFRENVQTSRLVKYYSDLNDLKSKVVTSINGAIKIFDRPGWIRADKMENTGNNQTYSKEEVKQMLFELQRDFREEVEKIKESIPKYEDITEEDIKRIFDSELEKRTATDEEVNAMLDEIFNKK